MTDITWQIALLIAAPVVSLIVILACISRHQPRRHYHPKRHHYDDVH